MTETTQNNQTLDLSHLSFFVGGREFTLEVNHKLGQRLQLNALVKKLTLSQQDITITMTLEEMRQFFHLVLKPKDGQLVSPNFFDEIDEGTHAEVIALFFISKALVSRSSEQRLLKQFPQLATHLAQSSLQSSFAQQSTNVN